MKKAVVMILLILPIVLIVTISFAGRIFAAYNHIYVENIYFVNELDNKLETNYVFKVAKGETKQTKTKILPELATVKDVKYLSQDTKIATVNNNGEITGINFGTTTIVVTTEDSNKTASLLVSVSNDNVSGVTLSVHNLDLGIGEIYQLIGVVLPITAINQNVVWGSNNSSIASVDVNGRVVGILEGKATITITTMDGGFTASCFIEVVKEKRLPLEFSVKPNMGEFYAIYSQAVNLEEIIMYNENIIELNQIKFKIMNGNSYATLNEKNILTINAQSKPITIVAYVHNTSYETELKIIWLKNKD